MANSRSQNVTINSFTYQVIDIEGIPKENLLAAFYNYSRPGSHGRFVMENGIMDLEDAAEMISIKADLISLGTEPPGPREDWHRFVKPFGSMTFEKSLHDWDYIKGRPMKINLGGSVIMPITTGTPEWKALGNLLTSARQQIITIFGRGLTLGELFGSQADYESPDYNNSPGIIARIIDALARGEEPPHRIAENIEVSSWVTDFLAGKEPWKDDKREL